MLKHDGSGDGDYYWFIGRFVHEFREGMGFTDGIGYRLGYTNQRGDGDVSDGADQPHVTALIIDDDPVTMVYQALIMQTTRGPHA